METGKATEVKKTKESVRPTRCEMSSCRKKLSLTDFPCRCKHFYCLTHRDPSAHICSINYFEEHKRELLRTMSSAVVGMKVETI